MPSLAPFEGCFPHMYGSNLLLESFSQIYSANLLLSSFAQILSEEFSYAPSLRCIPEVGPQLPLLLQPGFTPRPYPARTYRVNTVFREQPIVKANIQCIYQ